MYTFFPDLKQDHMHKHIKMPRSKIVEYHDDEKTAEYWNKIAQDILKKQLNRQINTGVAKNVILFLGDGMSIPTLAATRVYLSQKTKQSGEENELSFEKMPFTGLSKTYCVDRQVADSACSATAYLCGVKANEATAGVTAAVELKDCEAMRNTSNHVFSIGRWSQLKGKRTGVVTTTRITHASPSGVYAHIANRDWESDSLVLLDGFDPDLCHDIAHQLIHGETGAELNVIFGGGRQFMIPLTEKDEDGNRGLRLRRNLIEEWEDQKAKSEKSYQYVHNREGLLGVSDNTEYVMGLFAGDHMDYNLDRSPEKQPSLEEMTVKAIKLLSQGENGYFLFVEGGRIDHAHHATRARKALDETVEFHKAIQAALDITDAEDTLIVVTSDHAHTMSLNGYPDRGNDILGIGGMGTDDLPYTTLSYSNGPGYRQEENGIRHDVSKDDLTDKDYRYPALVPLWDETHGGDDVGIFARGPWAHLYSGVLEQNTIPHIMAYASCVNDGENACT
ncbi:hypothetical protein ILUMI_13594 [Ignelater luminosus]|uniref:Alkaline phosphatase n=1 Tax=Ignelater luminosus TaxID=2038154 RepID=A0A8K0CVX6_IGNLU|nr:hypothetical protein ILUMI_13594 [Ignelater luminosus]